MIVLTYSLIERVNDLRQNNNNVIVFRIYLTYGFWVNYLYETTRILYLKCQIVMSKTNTQSSFKKKPASILIANNLCINGPFSYLHKYCIFVTNIHTNPTYISPISPVSPLYHLYITSISPLLPISPLYQLQITFISPISPLYHLYTTYILPIYIYITYHLYHLYITSMSPISPLDHIYHLYYIYHLYITSILSLYHLCYLHITYITSISTITCFNVNQNRWTCTITN